MKHQRPHNKPSEVTAEEGEVQLDGPDDLALSMTPDAAEETSDRLKQGVKEAREQAASTTDQQEPIR